MDVVIALVLPLVGGIFIALSQNELDELLFDAVAAAKSVSITLVSGKVYVGFVLGTTEPRTDRRMLAILPLLSGYRTETHEVHFTTYYDEIYRQSESADDDEFRLILPIDKVVSVALFDPVIYERFRALPQGVASAAATGSDSSV